MAPRQVSAATKAMISREEMDAALARLPRLPVAPQNNPNMPTTSNMQLVAGIHPSAIQPAALRIQRIDTASAAFLYGSRDTMLDTACDFLAPDLRPVPPQPNCAQSMKIYEDHRKMAAEYLQVKTEMAELRNYKAQLQDQLAKGETEAQASQDEAQFAQLQSEKEALMAFKEKLAEQLAMIEAAQAQTGSAESTGSGEGWVVVGDSHQGGRPGTGGEDQ